MVEEAGSKISIQKKTPAGLSELASAVLETAMPVGVKQELAIKVTAGQIEAYVNGVLAITAEDSDLAYFVPNLLSLYAGNQTVRFGQISLTGEVVAGDADLSDLPSRQDGM